MSLTWIICPIGQEYIPCADCLECARMYQGQVDPKTGQRRLCDFRYPLLRRIVGGSEGRTHAGVSATMLTGCLRKALAEAYLPYAQSPYEALAAQSGTAWHEWLDGANEGGVVAEKRLRYTLPSGRTITGKQDRFVPDYQAGPATPTPIRIEDMKRKKNGKLFTTAPYYYTVQLNIYRLMAERGSTIINGKGEAIGCYGPVRVTKMTLHPSAHGEEGRPVDVPFLPLDAVQSYVERCLDAWEAAVGAHEGRASRGSAQAGAPQPGPLGGGAVGGGMGGGRALLGAIARREDPERSIFCQRYCPFFSECRRVGGPTEDLLEELLREAYH